MQTVTKSVVPKFITDSITQVDGIFEYIDKSLGRPDDVATKMETDLQMKVYKDMKPILKIVEDFIIKHKCILYGGTALNMILPPEYKFYDETEIPDYDFFSPAADTLAVKLADILKNKGYKYTEVRHAIHPGTYKVFCNFEAVADITNIPSKEHKILSSKAEKINMRGKKMLISPVPFLKSLAYKELCMPLGSSFRWTKVYKRLLLTEAAFPTQVNTNNSTSDLLTNECNFIFEQDKIMYENANIVETYLVLKGIVDKLKYPYCGLDACEVYLKQVPECKNYFAKRDRQTARPIEILSDNPSHTLGQIRKELLQKMGKHLKFDVKVEQAFEEFHPEITCLYLRTTGNNKVPILKVVDCSRNCFAIIEKDKQVYTSIFFLYYMTYMKLLVEPDQKQINEVLIIMLSKYLINKDEFDLIETFTSRCYGNEKSMLEIRKENWDMNKKVMFYRPK